uniref:Uncharacterized protein n=1 Tax=Lepeophtheirus salmonis TaxID=72036 RepID=A0A0K2SZ13_LEPSM
MLHAYYPKKIVLLYNLPEIPFFKEKTKNLFLRKIFSS